MATWHYGGHIDPEDKSPDALGQDELIKMIAYLRQKQERIEDRLTVLRDVITALHDAMDVAEMGEAELYALAASAPHPTVVSDPVVYRFGRIVPLVKKALNLLEPLEST